MRLTKAVCANYLQKFMKWTVYDNTGYTLRKPLSKPREIRRKHWFFSHHKTWSAEGIQAGQQGSNILVEPLAEKDKKIFLGDRVEVLTGSDEGKIGMVSKIFEDTNMCIVRGLNLKKKTQDDTIECEEKPLLLTSEIALIDPAEQTKTEIEWRYNTEGERVRVSLKSGRIIPLSATYYNTAYDGVDKASYKDCDKDTSSKILKKVTYIPKLTTFEEDINEEMGIVETRVRQTKYWY